MLLIPVVGGIYTKYKQAKMYEVYQQNMEQLAISMQILEEALEDQEEEVQVQGIGNNYRTQDVESIEDANGLEVIGILSIPKIDVEILLVEGVSTSDLKYAAGHMPGTAMPGEIGNCSIAGHRSYTFGKYFNRLDELEEGDKVEIMYQGEQYTYEVYEAFLVEPTDVEVIEPQGDQGVITLITCHPVINATHRLIVRGRLIEQKI